MDAARFGGGRQQGRLRLLLVVLFPRQPFLRRLLARQDVELHRPQDFAY